MKQKNYSAGSFWDKREMDKKTKVSGIMLSVIIFQAIQNFLKVKSTKEDYDKGMSQAGIYPMKPNRFVKMYMGIF